MKKVLYILIFSFICSQKVFSLEMQDNNLEKCNYIRTAFYVSDTSIKGKIAKIDTCNKKILFTIKEQSIPISIPNEIFSLRKSKMIDQGLIYEIVHDLFKIKTFLEVDCQNNQCIGLIGGSISAATINNKVLIEYIKSKLNINMNTILLNDEPRIGFLGILSNDYFSKSLKEHFVLLDIRENTYQISNNNSDSIETFNFNYSPENFKNDISKILNKTNENSLCPLNREQISLALSLGRKELIKKASFLKDIIQKKHNKIYATGNIIENFKLSAINSQNNFFTRVDILNSIGLLTDLDNNQIAKTYPNAKNSPEDILINALFIYSAMSTLETDRFSLVRAAPNIDGLLVDNDRWK